MSQAAPLQVTRIDEITVIGFPPTSQEITQLVLDRISDPILDAVTPEAPRVLLDLEGIRFFGSSFIELMFRLWNRVKGKAGGEFALCNVTPYCQEVLDVTNLSKVWKVFPTRLDALTAIQRDANGWTTQL